MFLKTIAKLPGGGGRTGGRSGDQGDGRIDGQGGQVSGQATEVNDGVDGVSDFSTIIAQQLQNLLPTIIAQVGDQGRGQGNGRNQNGDAINDNIRGDVRNVIENNDRKGCTYKEFLACNPKEYDGKGGSYVVELPDPYTRMRNRCRNGSIKKNHDKRGNRGEPSKDRNVRDDNKRSRTPSDLGFSYEIEIASVQLVEIDKVTKGYKLEIEGHEFDINLIPFGSGSFDVIIGMDWLSNHKAEIICHEKVVTIHLLDGKVLRMIGERPKEKMRHLRSAKTKEQKQEEIVVVRDYLEVFPDDLSGLAPNREIKFRIELVPGAILVAKSPYRLAPSEMEELSGQLKEL
ncbi:putative reverse transcriptase domain-containing protein [Tanacetum coccineum]